MSPIQKDQVKIVFRGRLTQMVLCVLDKKAYMQYLDTVEDDDFDPNNYWEYSWSQIPVITPGEVNLTISINGKDVCRDYDISNMINESTEDESGVFLNLKSRFGFILGWFSSDDDMPIDPGLHSGYVELKKSEFLLEMENNFKGEIIFEFETDKFDITHLIFLRAEIFSDISNYQDCVCAAVYYKHEFIEPEFNVFDSKSFLTALREKTGKGVLIVE